MSAEISDLPVRGRIIKGISYGIPLAVVYSAFAGLIFLISDGAPPGAGGLSFEVIVIAYFGGGIVGGALVGMLIGFARDTRIGAFLIGSIGAAPFMFGVILLVVPDPSEIDVVLFAGSMGSTLLGGPLGVVHLYKTHS